MKRDVEWKKNFSWFTFFAAFSQSRKCRLGNNMYRREKSVVGEMCSRVNIRSGKCLVGQMSGRGNVKSVSVGELSSRGCVSRGSVGRGNVQSGKCPDPVRYAPYSIVFKGCINIPKNHMIMTFEILRFCPKYFKKKI